MKVLFLSVACGHGSGGIIPARGATCANTLGKGTLRCPQVSREAVGEAVGAETGVWLVGKPNVLTQFMKTPATE